MYKNKLLKSLKLTLLILFIVYIIVKLIEIYPSYIDPLKYRQSFTKGINFKDSRTPHFLKFIEGVSWAEPWGTWTDAKKGDAVRIQFKPDLPHKFTLELTAIGYGPNANEKTIVKLINPDKSKPSIQYQAIIGPTPSVYTFDFSILDQRDANTIEIIPPKPISPKSINHDSDDERLIGIGLINLKIKPIK